MQVIKAFRVCLIRETVMLNARLYGFIAHTIFLCSCSCSALRGFARSILRLRISCLRFFARPPDNQAKMMATACRAAGRVPAERTQDCNQSRAEAVRRRGAQREQSGEQKMRARRPMLRC